MEEENYYKSSDPNDSEYVTTYPDIEVDSRGEDEVYIHTNIRILRDGEYYLCSYDNKIRLDTPLDLKSCTMAIDTALYLLSLESELINHFARLPSQDDSIICKDKNQISEVVRISKLAQE